MRLIGPRGHLHCALGVDGVVPRGASLGGEDSHPALHFALVILAADGHHSTWARDVPSAFSVTLSRYRYRAFGARTDISGIAPARQDPSFQNRTFDAGLGIYDYRNRSFDPATGRFMQRDPVMGGDELYNPYCFPGNNPVSKRDPTGEDDIESQGQAVLWVMEELVDTEPGMTSPRRTEDVLIGRDLGDGSVRLLRKYGGGRIRLDLLRTRAKNYLAEFTPLHRKDEVLRTRTLKEMFDKMREWGDLGTSEREMRDEEIPEALTGVGEGSNVFANRIFCGRIRYFRENAEEAERIAFERKWVISQVGYGADKAAGTLVHVILGAKFLGAAIGAYANSVSPIAALVPASPGLVGEGLMTVGGAGLAGWGVYEIYQGQEAFNRGDYSSAIDRGFSGGLMIGGGWSMLEEGAALQFERQANGVLLRDPIITAPYSRPSYSVTAAQRRIVQGQPCAVCGRTAPRMVAGHREALVIEHYRTGTIDMVRMRSVFSVRPECPTCSASEGHRMQVFSKEMRAELGLD